MSDALSDFQIIDHESGLVYPWLVHGCLHWIKQQDWKDKKILMFGGGFGDLWLAKRCKSLDVVERKQEWCSKLEKRKSEKRIDNLQYYFRPCDDSSGKEEYYLEIIEDGNYDIIINDDAYRTEVCQAAVDIFQGRGGILICDNWIQSYVWISPKAEEILNSFDNLIFEQPEHTDNDGINKWKTAVFFIK